LLAKGQGAKTTGAIAVLEGLSRLQDQELAKRFNIEPAPRAVAQEYLSLYPNRVQGILRPPGCKAWTTVSKHWPIPDETILRAVAGEEKNLYGLRWGDQTRLAVFDIDNRSKYHHAGELQKLQTELTAVGLTATLYQSSESGGWHIYIFLDEWTDSSNLRETLKKWLYGLGYEIRNGTLEIFPSGMGLRLPLQRGFAWLDDSGNVTRRREELSKDEALAAFLNDLEENKRNWSEAKNRIGSQLEAKRISQGVSPQEHKKAIDTDGFDGLFNYRLIPEKYQDGRQYWQEGLSKNGQRHDAILAVEHYLWHGDNFAGAGIVPALPGEWNDDGRYRLILAWLQKKHNGFCNHINRGNWRKVEAQIRRAVKWRRPSGAFQVRIPYMLTENSIERLIALSKSTGRTWTQEDLRKGNDGRAAQAREKIEAAVQELIDKGRRVTGRQIMRITGCSYHTVKRHLDIWKILPVVALPRAAGDQNPFLDLIGAGGNAPGPDGSGTGSEKEFLDPSCSGDSRQTELLPGQPAQIPDPAFDVCDDFCSLELAPIVITPPLLLPGSKPTSEHPASSPSPAGCFASLDAGALVRRYSGRTADDAGGLEPGRSGIEHAGCFVCYTCDIAGGIKERGGAASTVVALASFGVKSKKKKIVSDTTNYRFLTTVRLGYPSGLADEISLIEELSGEHLCVDVRGLSSQAESFEVSLHQPTASAPEITSACLQCCVRVFRFSIVTQTQKNEAGGGCRQLLGQHLGILLGLDVRGPPNCRQLQQANLGN
jgi:hypothetical protein